jgi:hypothetical protein
MAKVSVLYSGSKWQYDLFTSAKYSEFISDIIPACSLPTTDLLAFDVFIVPRESNQEILLESKPKLIEFLNKGKLLISFGEVTRPWLPFCVWENRYPGFTYKEDGTKECIWDKGQLVTEPYRILDPEHSLFKNLTIEDLQWHFHGMFKAPASADVLLRYGENGDIIYLDSKNFKGKILATTLDPDVHAGYGVVKKTQKFLDNVLNWAIIEAAQ